MTETPRTEALTAEEEAVLRGEVEGWNPRCAFTVLHVPEATTAMSECGIARSNHHDDLDGHSFEERPSDRATIRRLLATLDAERAARQEPADQGPASGLRAIALRAQGATTREQYEQAAAELVRAALTEPES